LHINQDFRFRFIQRVYERFDQLNISRRIFHDDGVKLLDDCSDLAPVAA